MTKNSEQKDDQIFYPEGKPITVAGEKFKIKPFVLENRIKVLRVIGEVIKSLSGQGQDLGKMAQGDIISLLINSAGEKLIDIYEIVLGKEQEWLKKKVQIKDELAIIEAVLEVNDINFLLQQVKSLATKVKA